MAYLGNIEVCQQSLRDWFRQRLLLGFFWCENPLPIGLCSPGRLRIIVVRVKATEKFDVHILVVGIVIPAAQSQDTDIGMLEGIEDAIIAAADAVKPAIQVLELLLDLRIGRRVLRQE